MSETTSVGRRFKDDAARKGFWDDSNLTLLRRIIQLSVSQIGQIVQRGVATHTAHMYVRGRRDIELDRSI